MGFAECIWWCPYKFLSNDLICVCACDPFHCLYQNTNDYRSMCEMRCVNECPCTARPFCVRDGMSKDVSLTLWLCLRAHRMTLPLIFQFQFVLSLVCCP